MSSKYIKNSRITNNSNHITVNKNQDMWYSFSTSNNPAELEEQKQHKLYKENQLKEKKRIENIPLEELSFRDLYKFPFHQAKYGGWVYDANSNFIFEFEFSNKETQEKTIKILNNELLDYKRQDVTNEDGEILIDNIPFILIRGWGNLTGVGAYNLNGKYAGKIQDSLQEFIIEKLSNQ